MKKIAIIFIIFLTSFCFAQAPIVPNDQLKQYKNDVAELLNTLLYKKITPYNKSYPEYAKELYKTSEISYTKLLIDNSNLQERQKIKYVFGVISAFSEDICSEFDNILYDKYHLDYYSDYVSQNLGCELYIAKNFLKPYKIKGVNDYINFINKLDFYQQRLYEMSVDLDLF